MCHVHLREQSLTRQKAVTCFSFVCFFKFILKIPFTASNLSFITFLLLYVFLFFTRMTSNNSKYIFNVLKPILLSHTISLNYWSRKKKTNCLNIHFALSLQLLNMYLFNFFSFAYLHFLKCFIVPQVWSMLTLKRKTLAMWI